MTDLRILTCNRCGWSWPTRKEHPVGCPMCRSQYYATPRSRPVKVPARRRV